jgi:hypothetical protein
VNASRLAAADVRAEIAQEAAVHFNQQVDRKEDDEMRCRDTQKTATRAHQEGKKRNASCSAVEPWAQMAPRERGTEEDGLRARCEVPPAATRKVEEGNISAAESQQAVDA